MAGEIRAVLVVLRGPYSVGQARVVSLGRRACRFVRMLCMIEVPGLMEQPY